MKKIIIRYILSAVVLLSAIVPTNAAPGVKLTISLDSAQLLMGKATPLHINITGELNDNDQLLIPKDTLNSKVEILRILDADTINHGNGRLEVNRDILIQSFDSGDYRLNPILFLSRGETISSNVLALRVIPVVGDSITLNDFADISDVDRKWSDYLPDFLIDYWWIFLIVILLAGGGAIWWFYFRKRKGTTEESLKEPLLPPYEQAVADLLSLRERKLCESGHEKEYYSLLTEILRVYLQRRFGINAMEMTSTQIMNALESNPDTRLPRRYMNQVLQVADFVKFAKVRPLPDDNVQAFNSAMQFVEETKPLPEITEPDTTILKQ